MINFHRLQCAFICQWHVVPKIALDCIELKFLFNCFRHCLCCDYTIDVFNKSKMPCSIINNIPNRIGIISFCLCNARHCSNRITWSTTFITKENAIQVFRFTSIVCKINKFCLSWIWYFAIIYIGQYHRIRCITAFPLNGPFFVLWKSSQSIHCKVRLILHRFTYQCIFRPVIIFYIARCIAIKCPVIVIGIRFFYFFSFGKCRNETQSSTIRSNNHITYISIVHFHSYIFCKNITCRCS